MFDSVLNATLKMSGSMYVKGSVIPFTYHEAEEKETATQSFTE